MTNEVINLEQLSERIDTIKRKSDRNRGRLEQLQQDKKRLLSELKSMFKIKSIPEAKKLLEKNHRILDERGRKLQSILRRLDKMMSASNEE